jgi:catechol 2,3-dioxygenase-like lactoylglutathione lyase family enzyme
VFDHVTIRVADRAASERFYETVAEQVHMAFPAAESSTEDAFHRAGTAAGYRDDGAPGPRPQYSRDYYSAFVLDPDGNNVEVVNHNRGASGHSGTPG